MFPVLLPFLHVSVRQRICTYVEQARMADGMSFAHDLVVEPL